VFCDKVSKLRQRLFEDALIRAIGTFHPEKPRVKIGLHRHLGPPAGITPLVNGCWLKKAILLVHISMFVSYYVFDLKPDNFRDQIL
jgi:hypothetical protein